MSCRRVLWVRRCGGFTWDSACEGFHKGGEAADRVRLSENSDSLDEVSLVVLELLVLTQ